MTQVTCKVEHKNPHWMDELIQDYKKLPGIAIGFPASSTAGIQYPNGEYVVNVAFWNNYGTRNVDGSVHIPARRFMDVGGLNATKRCANSVRKLIQRINDRETGLDIKKEFDKIGSMAAGEMQMTIRDWEEPPNALSTQIAKGDNNPLEDTGLLKKSVAWEIRYNHKYKKFGQK